VKLLATILLVVLSFVAAPAALASQSHPGPAPLGTARPTVAAPAVGIIVTARGAVSEAVLGQIEDIVGRDVVGQVELGDSTVAVHFTKSLPSATVESMAKRLSALPEISAVTPDLQVMSDALPNDPYMARQINLSAPAGSGATTYDVGASTMWDATSGKKSVVVALLDGGLSSHTDLSGQTVKGYDMISDTRYSGDGNGRDSDPSDPGNYSDGSRCTKSTSTWHGTHTAGIVGALKNNGKGVAGLAPGVALQEVRVVGRCVTTMSDVIAGIRWAAGGHVSGISDNKTPAKVINLSLSSSVDDFTCPAAYQEVIDEARSRGSMIVASSGNQSLSVLTRTPANCDGVVSVGAIAPDGRPTTYTNVGRTLDLVAPGGVDPKVAPDLGIWSTLNSGTKGPKDPTYGQMSGTSMAAPTVSAAAALVFSLGDFTADQVTEALKSAAVKPPRFDDYYTCISDDDAGNERTVCGAGILNVARIPAPTSPPTISGTFSEGSVLTVTPAHWNGAPDELTYEWLRDGASIAGETGETHTVTADDLGHRLTVRSTAHTAGFPDFSTLSATFPRPTTGTLSESPATFTVGQKIGLMANFPDSQAKKNVTFLKESSPGSNAFVSIGVVKSGSTGNATLSGYTVNAEQRVYAKVTDTQVTEIDTLTPQVAAPVVCSDVGNLTTDPVTFATGQKITLAANFADDQANVDVAYYRKDGTSWTKIGVDEANSSGNAYLRDYAVNGTQEIYAQARPGKCTETDTITPQ
jgi:serine protease